MCVPLFKIAADVNVKVADAVLCGGIAGCSTIMLAAVIATMTLLSFFSILFYVIILLINCFQNNSL